MNPVEMGIERAFELYDSGRADEAATACRSVIAMQPANVQALFLLASIVLDQRAFGEAAVLFESALAMQPDVPEARNHLGTAYLSLGRAEEALASFERALALAPDVAEFHNNCGSALLTLGRQNDALASFDRALAIEPAYVEARYNRGTVLLRSYRAADALREFDQVIVAAPAFAEGHYNRSIAQVTVGEFEKCLESLARVLALKPDHAAALALRANVLQLVNRHEEAAQNFNAAAAAAGEGDISLIRESFCRAFYANVLCCDWTDYEVNARRFIEIATGGEHPVNPFAFLFVSDSPEEELICTRTYSRILYPPASVPLWRGERYDHDRIRIAYLSSDFRQHAVGYLSSGLFAAHDRDRFEVYGVSFWPDESYMRRRIMDGFDEMIDAVPRSDYDVALLLREMEIDVAIHLNGHTSPDRIGILAHRIAPVQVNYLGYPGTMGVDYVDYIVADRHVIPPGDERFYTEKVVWLPECYQVNDGSLRIGSEIPTRAEVGLPEGAFVFCAFNKNAKITPGMFAVWMRILHRVPNSVLWLIENNPAARKNLLAAAATHGIPEGRLVFASYQPLTGHLARHTLANLFIDTLPYTAHTTASDALRCGVPVVTVRGRTFSGRVASSLLQTVGLPELITESLADYEALIYRLATSPALLAELKARLLRNLTTTPLYDTHRTARHLEAAYTEMWKRQQRGEPPASFAVPAHR